MQTVKRGDCWTLAQTRLPFFSLPWSRLSLGPPQFISSVILPACIYVIFKLHFSVAIFFPSVCLCPLTFDMNVGVIILLPGSPSSRQGLSQAQSTLIWLVLLTSLLWKSRYLKEGIRGGLTHPYCIYVGFWASELQCSHSVCPSTLALSSLLTPVILVYLQMTLWHLIPVCIEWHLWAVA